MAATVQDAMKWGVDQDQETGHRTYTIDWYVTTSDPLDGPYTVLSASNAPAIGSTWTFGNDNDPWAFCLPGWKCFRLYEDNSRHSHWVLRQKFSTRPINRCQSSAPENPINEPPDISGSFQKYTAEAIFDRNGDLIKTSSFERIRGKAVERDYNRPTVRIKMNFATIPLGTIAAAIDDVNDATLWGLSKRMVKLSDLSWSKKYYQSCSVYYTVDYGFDIDFNTFDVEVLDEGTKVCPAGKDETDPKNFVNAKDKLGDKVDKVLLDGSGRALAKDASPVKIKIEKYEETNLLLLGIPTSL